MWALGSGLHRPVHRPVFVKAWTCGILQRMLNAIEPCSPLPIHRHRSTSETVVVLRGRLVWEFYDELERICTEAIEVSASGAVCGLNISAGQWHTVKALESGSVILEMNEGGYEALSDADILSL